MSQKQPSSDLEQEIPWEEAVARYLEEHPDYFQRHPELLARIALTHAVGGRAVSLIERQVQVLRDQGRNLQRQLRDLIGNARDNDVLADRLHRFALAMVDGRTLDDVLDAAGDLLRGEFRLDGMRILLRARDGFPTDRAEVVGDDAPFEELLRRLASGKPLCGEAPEAAVLRHLFGDQAADIKTCAQIPLGGASPYGLLALGSRDPYRFHAGMGTVYLTRLGELLAHGLARHRH
jgi:uncharacterized protein YigA (DUF484 family)